MYIHTFRFVFAFAISSASSLSCTTVRKDEQARGMPIPAGDENEESDDRGSTKDVGFFNPRAISASTCLIQGGNSEMRADK